MDEVDKIIVHSLRQIGCSIEGDIDMGSFTPELLVHTVSKCLQEIKPALSLPNSLPPNMAQRFAAATTLAELCAACGGGYRSDIGYQTFLYPNAVDVRRLLMFLIEQLPKDNRALSEPSSQSPTGEYETLQLEIKEKMDKQLHGPWVPQYSRLIGNPKLESCSSQQLKFRPHPNLNIP